jgi:hypothetical protein
VGTRDKYNNAANGAAAFGTDEDIFWSSQERLLIIRLPYKNGTHRVTKPTDFIRIIKQLAKLHGHGLVHGDIRGFNVLFGEEGGLIDFDLSGREGKGTYPQGYQQALTDGFRLGQGGAKDDPDNKLQFCHDWFALGKLIFFFHKWVKPTGDSYARDRDKFLTISDKWIDRPANSENADIEELQDALQKFEDRGFTVVPGSTFKEDLTD